MMACTEYGDVRKIKYLYLIIFIKMIKIDSIVEISHLSNSDKIHIVLTDTCLHKLMSNFIIKLMKCRN